MSALHRRQFLRRSAWLAASASTGLGVAGCAGFGSRAGRFSIATFNADVTVPLGHALMGGGIAPAREVVDPLRARGFVLLGAGAPIVLAVVDWCEIRNDAYARWRAALAEAAGTSPDRVLVSSVHVHDAPVADLGAERLLRQAKAAGSVCDLAFHESAVQRVCAVLRASLASPRAVTHFSHGMASVDRIASNRRFLRPDGTRSFGRTSASRDPIAHQADVGTIDPMLRTLAFWDRDQPVAALHCYATHPMSYYGKGGVSADFVGVARSRRQAEAAGIFQIYASGCSGNVTAGRHNDGAPENRAVLADRLYRGMREAWTVQTRRPLGSVDFRSVRFELEPRGGAFTEESLRQRLASDPKPFAQCLAALGLSWRARVAAGIPLDLPVIDFGSAQLLLLPAETYVEFQLFAQQTAANKFVMTLGYGECAPGYIPIDRAWEEGDTNLGDWCWVAPGAEGRLKTAIRKGMTG